MTEQEYNEMMDEITSDPSYIAHMAASQQKMMDYFDSLTNEELEALYPSASPF